MFINGLVRQLSDFLFLLLSCSLLSLASLFVGRKAIRSVLPLVTGDQFNDDSVPPVTNEGKSRIVDRCVVVERFGP